MAINTITFDDDKFKLVPVEPTKEMWAAVNKLDDEMAAGGYDGKGCSIEQAWDCLLAAAPTPPSAPVQQSAAWRPLTDAQWLKIVNQDHAYDEYTKDDAVHKAVRLTEARLRMNNTALSTSPLLDKNDQAEGEPVDIDCTNMDAAHWAKAFCEKFPGHDEGLMLAWFASAIMCGWDNAHWKIKESNPQPDSNELVELADEWDRRVKAIGRDCGSYAECSEELRAALAQSPSVGLNTKKGG